MSKLRLTLAIAAVASLVTGATVADAGTKTIEIGDNWFVKDTEVTPTVRIPAGSTIRWKWVGYEQHNVRVRSAPKGVTRSKLTIPARTSGTRRVRLTKAGTYRFYCSIHDGYDRQRVTVRVRSAS